MSYPTSNHLTLSHGNDHAHTAREADGGVHAILAMGCLWVIILFAVFSPGASLQFSHGILYLLAGSVMVALPPRVALPRIPIVLSLVFLILCSLCFLPESWFPVPAWRTALQGAGLGLGNRISPHPQQSFEHLAADAIGLLVTLYILTQVVTGKTAALFVM
ncbi:MAG: hypothetical protein WCN98_14310, partial [Verrucomicrobiaceae bacterium]